MAFKIGNRVTEKDIRDWLDENQYYGGTAVINDLELHAIKRPGWVQVFRFHVQAKLAQQNETNDSQDDPIAIHHERFGVVLDDERIQNQNEKTQIWLFESEIDRDQKLEQLSQDMIVRNKKSNAAPLAWVSFTFLLFLIIASLIDWLFR